MKLPPPTQRDESCRHHHEPKNEVVVTSWKAGDEVIHDDQQYSEADQPQSQGRKPARAWFGSWRLGCLIGGPF